MIIRGGQQKEIAPLTIISIWRRIKIGQAKKGSAPCDSRGISWLFDALWSVFIRKYCGTAVGGSQMEGQFSRFGYHPGAKPLQVDNPVPTQLAGHRLAPASSGPATPQQPPPTCDAPSL